jgi:hypothetical protein
MRDFSEADTWSRIRQERASWKLSRYVVATDPVFDEDDCLTKRVVFATRTAAVRAIDEFTWQNLTARRFEQLPAAFFRDYCEIGLIVPEEQHELQFLLEENDLAAAQSDDLYIVVQPTTRQIQTSAILRLSRTRRGAKRTR